MSDSGIVAATQSYETWLREQIPVVEADLAVKHAELAGSTLRFLRGTYYWWLRRSAALVPRLLDAPAVPLVGDLHVENFGTWRDQHGVWRWGINDLDELGRGPYPADLLRLATSGTLTSHVPLEPARIAAALLDGYHSATPGHAVDLDSGSATDTHHLRRLLPAPRSDGHYYAALCSGTPVEAEAIPAAVRAAAQASAGGGWVPSWHARQAGTGSLGHPRYVGVHADVAREVKVFGPPSNDWARVAEFSSVGGLYETVQRTVLGPWPAARVDGWQLRRLAPDVVRVELDGLDGHDVERVLHSMARALADVHGSDPDALAAARADAAARSSRHPHWLAEAVTSMAADTRAGLAHWRGYQHSQL